jgi:hypothetical protein
MRHDHGGGGYERVDARAMVIAWAARLGVQLGRVPAVQARMAGCAGRSERGSAGVPAMVHGFFHADLVWTSWSSTAQSRPAPPVS